MRDVSTKPSGLIVLACLLSIGGCSNAWRAWWEAHDRDPGDNPPSEQDAGRPTTDAGAEVKCGSRGLPACAEGQFCNFPEASSCGETDAPGTCADIPEVCTFIYSPVCGCDGKTYSNACVANAASVSVRTQGECPDGGAAQSCGGLRGLQCAEGEYCSYPPDAICGRADATGICAPKPEGCTQDYRPVCGCDGQTYGNACTAAAAGISVEFEGECPVTVCGGLLGVQCADGQYCDYAAGDGCDVADGQGRCAVQPEICTRIYQPVCGCNGQTYGNPCEAAAAGVSVRSEGECAGTTCGGIAGVQCPDGQYCDYTAGDGCEIADGQGKCAVQPEVCPEIYQPVCGCNGETYGNACFAAAGGASVRSQGECPDTGTQ